MTVEGAKVDEGREVFRFLHWAWDVDKAREILQRTAREPRKIGVNQWCGLADMIHVDEERLPHVDMGEPVIVVMVQPDDARQPEFPMLIDGWHRLQRAKNEGVEWLEARLLTAVEEREVRISGGTT